MYRYEENVTFHPVVQVGYLLSIAFLVWAQMTGRSEVPWLGVAIGIPLVLLPLMFGRLLIRIDHTSLMAEFGYLGWPIQRIALANIAHARLVSYRPIRQFGGWGIRAGRLDGEQTSVYTVRGTTGVLLELTQEQRISGFRTKRFLVGSAEPERLIAALGKG